MSLAAAPAVRPRCRLCAAETRAPAASLIAPPGCGGGKAAAAALLCVACVRVRPAWGPPRVPLQCRAGEGPCGRLGRGEAGPGGGLRGRARGSSGVCVGGSPVGGSPVGGPPAPPPRSPSSPGTAARGPQAPIGLTQPRGSPRPFHFPASSEGMGGGESVKTRDFSI